MTHSPDKPSTVEAEQRDSVAYLAGLACKMPWEDRAPLSARMLFQNAVTPELFCELLGALRALVATLSDQDDEGLIEHAEPMQNARAVIAKATSRAP